MTIRYLLIIASLAFSSLLYSQQTAPKYEFRGVWIATVSNIDWPSEPGLKPEQQRQEFLDLLDYHQSLGLNAVIVQVRAASDAFYKSKTEPWSYWLTGKQGKAPRPFYDPLEFMVKECHDRGMELHAWINPFRATTSANMDTDKDHITNKKPEWIIEYAGQKVINPGIPEARKYIVDIIKEIVSNYDVEAIHFDDYFYPYPENGNLFPDLETFKDFKDGFKEIDDWRRNNINLLIEDIHNSINQINPKVKFGISPFGIWRNKNTDSLGSATFGLPSYDAIYADSRKWMEKGWIDYIVPQIYWSQNNKAANYDTLTEWWSKNSFNRHLYIGHAPYKIDNDQKDESWKNYSEIPNQIRRNRDIENIYGSVYFSSRVLKANKGNLADSIKQQFYKNIAFTPPMKWKDSVAPEPPEFLKVKQTKEGMLVSWNKSKKASDGDLPKAYIVYRFTEKNFSTKNPATIAAVVSAKKDFFLDTLIKSPDSIEYGVTAIDRFNNESSICLKTRLLAESEIKKATLYLDRAVITRECKALADHKPVKITVKNLPKDIDYSNLQVSTNPEVELISYKHDYYFPEPKVDELKMLALKDSVAYIKNSIEAIEDSLEIYSKIEQFLISNQNVSNSNIKDVTIDGIKEFAEYFESKMFEIKEIQRNLTNRKHKAITELTELESKFTIKPVDINEKKSLVEIAIVAAKETEASINISYMTKQAGWKPEYNFFTSDKSKSFKLEYFANVWQSTGEDWNSIDLTLATLDTNFEKGQTYSGKTFEYSLVPKDSNISTSTESNPFNYRPIESYQCSLPVSIKNNDRNLKIKVRSLPTAKSFVYKAIPSKSLDAIKIARIYDWEKLNLFPGKMNVFHENIFMNSFDLKLNQDTLTMIIANEPSIKITQEFKKAEKPGFPKSLLNKEKEIYQIEVFNKKDENIRIVIEEPLPTSTDERLVLKPASSSKNFYSTKNNMFNWDLELKPKTKKTLHQEFYVKYPKKFKVNRNTAN